MGVPTGAVWCLLLLFPHLLALPPAQGQPAPASGVQFVPLLPGSFGDEIDVEKLASGRAISESLGPDEQRVIRFGLAEAEGGAYPNVAVWLQTTNPHGNADLKCGPWAGETERQDPNLELVYPWVSEDTAGLDAVFLPSNSQAYQAAVTSVPVTGADGNRETVPVAAFLCVVSGSSATETEFEFSVSATLGGVKLVENERDAVRAIASDCCKTGESCQGWPGPEATPGAGQAEDETDGYAVATNLCHVPGNICDSRGRLVKMSLRGFGLQCKIPEELGAFGALQKLDAGGNAFVGGVGELSAVLKDVVNLTRLSLASSGLTGPASARDGLCELVSNGVQVLELQENDIVGQVPECLLGANSSLVELDLSRTLINGSLPDVIVSASPLERIKITDTGLSGTIPTSLLEAEFVTMVKLTNNSLTGAVPNILRKASILESFHVGVNRLSALPDNWSDSDMEVSKFIKTVDVSHNVLKAKFPIGLGNAKNLGKLNLGNNRLSGTLPESDRLFPNVRHLNISFNNFEGPIPASWEGLRLFSTADEYTEDGVLDFRNNSLSGDLPRFLFTSSSSRMRTPMVLGSGNNVTCPDDRETFSIVWDACPPGLDRNATEPEEEHEQVQTELTPVDNEASSESLGKEQVLNGKLVHETRRHGSSGPANIVAAIVMGLLGVAAFSLIMVFIYKWRKRKQAPHQYVRHVRLEDVVEMS